MELIICSVTGTVLDLASCYIVDPSKLNADDVHAIDEGSDADRSAIAIRAGISVEKMGWDTGWGDNKYRYTISYSPQSLRDEADSILDGGIYDDPEDAEYKTMLEWVINEATEEELANVADWIMGADHVWDGFRQNLMEGLTYWYRESKKK